VCVQRDLQYGDFGSHRTLKIGSNGFLMMTSPVWCFRHSIEGCSPQSPSTLKLFCIVTICCAVYTPWHSFHACKLLLLLSVSLLLLLLFSSPPRPSEQFGQEVRHCIRKGGVRFESRLGHRLSWQACRAVYPSPQPGAEIVNLRAVHACHFPSPFKFTERNRPVASFSIK
jgi:hypothetical protein